MRNIFYFVEISPHTESAQKVLGLNLVSPIIPSLEQGKQS